MSRFFYIPLPFVLLSVLLGTTVTAQSDPIPLFPPETVPFPSSPPGNGGISAGEQRINDIPKQTHVNPLIPGAVPSVPLHDAVVPSSPIDQEELKLVLQNGLEMESESRWAEVLNHYETALRIYRNDDTLMKRYRFARFHYDVAKRSRDSSYTLSVQRSAFPDTFGFYEEIISRIQRDYVDLPHWDQLFRYGIQDIAIALSDAHYRANINLNVPIQKVNAYLETMQKTADGWEIRNRDDMKNGIFYLAEMAQQQIGLNPSAMLMEFTCGIVNSLDPYSAYLTPNQLKDQFSMISGNLVGLGVELRSDSESLIIVRVIPGSPAKENGLKVGDRILSVDGMTTKGRDTDSAADLLQGLEGTEAKLQVQTGQQTRDVRIIRRQIEVPSVEDVQMLNAYLAYIKLTGFQSKTCDEMKAALKELQQKGMRCLVLDMRHNPGGLLQIGVEVANLFISNGPIVRTRGRNIVSDFPYMATSENTWHIPLIVLIDEESASAAEIVAGAIRDHKRGIIVGRRSYGKGTIQQILSVKAGDPPHIRAGLRLTVEKFYSPWGLPYSGVGVSPDVLVGGTQRPHFVARQVDGKLKMPVLPSRISSDLDDPFIRQAVEESRKIVALPSVPSF